MSGGMMRGRDIVVDDALDRIYKAWILHRVDEDLSIADRFMLERMEFIDARLKEGGARSRFRNVVEETYEAFNRAHGVLETITRRTIETDIARTKRFFLSVRPRTDKDYGKGMSIEHGKAMLDKLDSLGKHKEWVVLFKEINDLEGFHKEDIERPDYDSVQPPPVMVVMDAADIGVPAIDNLEDELRILSMPKKEYRKTDQIEDAEDLGGSE